MGSVFRSSELRIPVGWSLYFPGEPPPDTVHDPRLIIIQQLAAFFQGEGHAFLNKIDYSVKLRALFEFSDLRGRLPVEGFSRGLEDTPVLTLACLGCALYEALFTGTVPLLPSEELIAPPSRKISVRVANYEPVLMMRMLKANYMNKFVAVRGTVIRTSTVRPLLMRMNFVCPKCSHVTLQFFQDGKYEVPPACTAAGCKNKNLQPDRASAETYDWQKIRLQEMVGDEEREEGRMPRTIECELLDDLVDSCIPGDEVTVTGIVKVMNTENEHGPRIKNRCLFLLYIEANAIAKKSDASPKDSETLQFSARDLAAIREIALDTDILRLLTNSICPAIFGHEKVKLALLLALFGGSAREVEKNGLAIRSDIHILIVGDPGLGKSQLLQAASSVAPRGVYVCGNTTSSAGLTVTVVKDGVTGDFALEAGALVLGDQGICCVDEFDKMGGEQQALLEAMEQQSISIAKAGIVCSLSARTSVLAAANPVSGHYNRGKTVNENLKLSRAILSRFDLIFILLDTPDAERDARLSEHIMALHSNRGTPASKKARMEFADAAPPAGKDSTVGQDLESRLKTPKNVAFDPIPISIFRKYISYAKKYCRPKLTAEAQSVIQEFYLSLRRKHQSIDTTPITTRQLESLIRLCEARAKMELRLQADKHDAEDVVELMKGSLFDIFTDEGGVVDFGRSSGMSKAAEAKRFMQEVHRTSERECNSLFTTQDLYAIAQRVGLRVDNFDEFVDGLNNQGFLLRKGVRQWQVASTSYSQSQHAGRRRGGAAGGAGW